ncbi:PH domain-containing protein [Streptomyces hiroshimensis]|uniref:Low molecular weight protein antigen 6 PH domain-containing protein n=1 Tax=Streptomyces hiroshimensis TaxID=66424 RepID=A0ABQ2YT15_9ACTN|nr:PH domain-containing protein [Streptomyces hiroshimensis]GGX93704.1 hypothetical protein GCM10010324_44680 [Streptomyces hiroshimensis]
MSDVRDTSDDASDVEEYRVTGIGWRVLAALCTVGGVVSLAWVTFGIGWGAYFDRIAGDYGPEIYAPSGAAMLGLPLFLGALLFAHRARTWVAADGLRTRTWRRTRFMPWQEITDITLDRHRFGNDGPYHNLYIKVRLRNGRSRKLPALSTVGSMYGVHADMVARWKAATGIAGVTGATGADTPRPADPRMVQLTK